MKLQSIKIDKYKNIEGLDIDMSGHEGLTVVIGNNASGKSNLLEALSKIFYNHYAGTTGTDEYAITYKSYTSGNVVELRSGGISPELPNRIVAVYSGEEPRLWKRYYKPLYDNYIKEIIGDVAVSFPKMLYLNRYYWHIALLCLLCSDASDVKTFIKENLGIQLVDHISFKKNTPDIRNSSVKNFAENLESIYSLRDFKKKVAEQTADLFLNLYAASTSKEHKIISDIIITFNGGQTIEDLSEGQKKQLLIKAALEFGGQEDTLFLLDEPDAHVHLSNKKTILDIVNGYRSNRHIIVTTHSPTLVRDCLVLEQPAGIIQLTDGVGQPVADVMKAAKYLADTDDVVRLLFNSRDIIIVEGKTDEKYIRRALELFREEYPIIDFEFLRVGGSDPENIKALLNTIEVPLNRRIIILSDRDKPGCEVYKCLFKSPRDRKDISMHKLEGRKNTYYLMMPHVNKGMENGDFVIEDYFSKSILKKLAHEVFKEQYQKSSSFKNFPSVNEKIKRDKLPNYCNTAVSKDMKNFKKLLSALNKIAKKPLQS